MKKNNVYDMPKDENLDTGYTENQARTVLYVSLHQETLIKFGNLADSKNIALDRYIDIALKEKLEREKV